jgi:hypothetical protein
MCDRSMRAWRNQHPEQLSAATIVGAFETFSLGKEKSGRRGGRGVYIHARDLAR